MKAVLVDNLVENNVPARKSTMNQSNSAVSGTTFSLDRFDAVVFDLDGVITQTAKVHAAAWKTMFDNYLSKSTAEEKRFVSFDIDTDYRRYVDGKPRYDGVRSFLKARGIELPYGTPDDPCDRNTICGLGNRKNELFRERLRKEGVAVYESTLTLIRTLRRQGIRIAVVSSSRNCEAVLEAAGIIDLFDARVDGVELQRLDLAGKPAPDMFIEASRRLGSNPERTAGIEDAASGVQAAKAAGFSMVIGINRGDNALALQKCGADIVVSDLAELCLLTDPRKFLSGRQLPSALDSLNEILPGEDREPALFLDYDGTLTPIVPDPKDAVLSDAMRRTLQRLSGLCAVTIISGRDLGDVRERVGIKGIWYAGSHGFDIAGPSGERNSCQKGREYLPFLDAAEQSLRDKLAKIRGCLVERKRFAIAVHYRRVAQSHVETVKQAAETANAVHPELRLTAGKKIFELQPAIDWDKGKALRWLMQALNLDSARHVPIYIGDDVTDEDAFRELAPEGIGILVAQEDQPTHAAYRLDNPAAVEKFLNQLGEKLARRRP